MPSVSLNPSLSALTRSHPDTPTEQKRAGGQVQPELLAREPEVAGEEKCAAETLRCLGLKKTEGRNLYSHQIPNKKGQNNENSLILFTIKIY